MKCSSKTFAFDLVNFVKFLDEDEIIKDFTEKLHCEFERKKEPYLSRSRERNEELKNLLDNSNLDSNEKSKCEQFFDANHRIVENALNLRRLQERLEDNLQMSFGVKLIVNSENDKITENLNNLVSSEVFDFNLFKQLWLTSPGRALHDLELLSFYIHSEYKPKNFDCNLEEDDIENSIFDKLKNVSMIQFKITTLISGEDFQSLV